MSVFDAADFDDHEAVHFVSDADTGLRAIIAMHDSTLGPALSGLRMFDYANPDDAVTDVLRLSRGMTFKNALAGIPYGGGKAVILGNPKTKKNAALMRALGRAIDRLDGAYITAEDVGTTLADMDILRTQTKYARGTSTGVGDPSPYTARGVAHAIRCAVREKHQTTNLSGIRVAIQGLGNVGRHLAEMLNAEGAELVVTDIDPARLEAAADDFGADVVDSDAIYSANVDVFAPCAMGAAINDTTLPQLQAKIVCGAANNQLAMPGHGAALADKGILYVPDFVANAGGVINIGLEGNANKDEIMQRVDAIASTVTEILTRSRTTGQLPTEVAESLARERIAAAAMAA